MAKVSGPLLSLDARGKIGGALVFSGWKGLQTVRQFVVPANPRSTTQQASRSKLAVAGKATKVTEFNSSFADYVRTIAPNGQSYASYVQKDLLGPNFTNIDAAIVAYNAGGNTTEKGYIDAAAADIGVEGVDLTSIGGVAYSAGQVLCALYQAAYRLGAPEATVDFSALTETIADDFAATLVDGA